MENIVGESDGLTFSTECKERADRLARRKDSLPQAVSGLTRNTTIEFRTFPGAYSPSVTRTPNPLAPLTSPLVAGRADLPSELRSRLTRSSDIGTAVLSFLGTITGKLSSSAAVLNLCRRRRGSF